MSSEHVCAFCGGAVSVGGARCPACNKSEARHAASFFVIKALLVAASVGAVAVTLAT